MRERVFGYWTLAWVGMISNIIALPISLSMVICGTAPYSIFRLITLKDFFGIGGLTLLSTLFSVLVLIYWCNPRHRRTIRL